jgi:hypothetical protein
MVAQRLPELPETEAAFRAGDLSEDQVALLCARTCGDAAGVALGRTVAELRRVLADHLPRGKSPERRHVAFGHSEDGSWRLWAELPLMTGRFSSGLPPGVARPARAQRRVVVGPAQTGER